MCTVLIDVGGGAGGVLLRPPVHCGNVLLFVNIYVQLPNFSQKCVCFFFAVHSDKSLVKYWQSACLYTLYLRLLFHLHLQLKYFPV